MKPEETVLLNIVNASVDFTTSESLKMSHDFDPNGERTVLIVTKIDRAEPGLKDKVMQASKNLKLPPGRVFCVKNRSQKENDEGWDLVRARAEEQMWFKTHDELVGIPDGAKGVSSLSNALVELQAARIRATLTKASDQIIVMIGELEGELARLSVAPESEAACWILLQQELGVGLRELSAQLTGRSMGTAMELDAASLYVPSCSLTIPDLKALRAKCKFGREGEVEGDRVEAEGGIEVYVQVYPKFNENGLEYSPPPGTGAGRNSEDCVGAFFHVIVPEHIESANVEWTLKAVNTETGKEIASEDYDHTFVNTGPNSNTGFGCREFIKSPVLLATLTGVNFCASEISIGDLKYKAPDKGHEKADELLCAELHASEEAFVESVRGLYSNSYLFSCAFRGLIKSETDRRLGAAGLPGAIAPEPPVAVINHLLDKFPPLIEEYINDVFKIVERHCRASLVARFDKFAALRSTVNNATTSALSSGREDAERFTKRMIKLERRPLTKNHYYMSTVQSLRAKVLADDKADDGVSAGDSDEQMSVRTIKTLKKLSNGQEE